MTTDPPCGRVPLIFILKLAEGASIRQSAEAAKVSATTGRRWARKAWVRQRVSSARADLFDQAAGRLAGMIKPAVDRLMALADGAQSEGVRLSAARAILEFATKMREDTDIESRLKALEEREHATASFRAIG